MSLKPEQLKNPCLNLTVKEDLISILNEAMNALERKDTFLLKEVSNHIVHCSSIFQTPETVKTAVVIYALSKIQERGIIINPEVINRLNEGKKAIEKEDTLTYLKVLETIFKDIAKLDAKLNLYVQQVISEAKIKKATKIYEHGISLAQTAEVAGTSLWDLMDYIGKTKISEQTTDAVSVKKRLQTARELFL